MEREWRLTFPQPSFTYPSGSRVKEHNLQVPLTELLFQSPPPVSKQTPLQVPERVAYGERCPFPESSFTYPLILKKSHMSLKVTGKGAPLHVPPTGPLWRAMLCLQLQWLICSFITLRVPSYRAFLQNGGKTYGHYPWSCMWSEGLHTVGCGMVPQGDHL